MAKAKPSEMDRLIGNRLRAVRLRQGMAQKELATHLGLTFQQIQKYEKGYNRISAATLLALAQYFRIPVNHFYAGAIDEQAQDDLDSMRLLSDFVRIGEPLLREVALRQVQGLAEMPSGKTG